LTYGYDPEGERVSLSATGETVEYVNENNLGLTKVLQRTKNGEVVRYVWGVGLLYEVNDSAEATYYHYDNYGSTTALTDDNEVVTDRVEYSPFGSITHREGTTDTPFLFTGFFGNQTEESGLVYMRARFYNPTIRRFVNADPAQQGWNWYAYAAGNPLGFVDPTGLGNASVLNAVQTGLSFLGMVPVVGFVADVANAGISVARGNYADAAINLAAAVPGIGQAVMGAKFAAAGLGVYVAIRAVDRLSDVGRGARNASKLKTVTSWADKGITPDLNAGRWVQLGEATKLNFWRTGLPGPKVNLSLTPPSASVRGSKVPFSNSITNDIPSSSLQWPPGLDKWRGLFGQRKIRGGGE